MVNLDCRPLGSSLGAEVHGVDLRGCDFFNFSSWHLSTEVIHSTAE